MNLMAIKLVQPQDKKSPKSGEIFEANNGIGSFGSVKRLMHGSENLHKAKRLRTRPPSKDSEDLSSTGDDLNSFLQIIRDSSDFKKDTAQKGNVKSPAKKPYRVEKVLSDVMLGSRVPEVNLGKTPEKPSQTTGSTSKLSRAGHHHKSSSSEDEKENVIPLVAEPKTDVAELLRDDQRDLVVSYSSWVSNDFADIQESPISCPVERKPFKELSKDEVKHLGVTGKVLTTSEENFSLLEDSWFEDGMEESFAEPKHQKKPKLEYVCFGFML